MYCAFRLLVFLFAVPIAQTKPISAFSRRASNETQLLTNLATISGYWGQISPYADNPEDHFGVQFAGLPDGCGTEDGENDELFASKVKNFTTAHPSLSFGGPLAFLNNYEYIMGASYLTGLGASAEFMAGVTFWNRYGRTLYNASVGQVSYNASYPNGTARPKPVLRTTSQSRIENSQINWALGFFGPSFQVVPDATVENATSDFNVVVIPEGGTENNTLASYDSCFNDNTDSIGYIGDADVYTYIPLYLTDATARINTYAPSGFQFTTNDTYAMQSICAYEMEYIGSSDFCYLFTEDEWAGFENTLDIEYYFDYSFGNPTGRAQGIGYVQELVARLQNQYITSSNSSVNSTIDDNAPDFPLGELFYADFTHDDIIVSVITALSMDYFREAPTLSQFPPDPDRHFILSHMTPFGGRLITEVIGCSSPDPSPVQNHRTQYYPTQYGYDASNAPAKFIRMRLNNGILPLNSIRGGACEGRIDGMCAMSSFLQSQTNAYALANYDFACFGNYTITNDGSRGQDYDGTISASGIVA